MATAEQSTPVDQADEQSVEAQVLEFTLADQRYCVDIEAVAEDGDPAQLGEELSMEGSDQIIHSGIFNTPNGADGPGPIGPGASYTFTVNAAPGHLLTFVTMYVQSNDLFYAFAPAGLALFDAEDEPVGGDVTGQVMLYDAGTEADQEPGVGLNQAPRQASADTGPQGEGSVVAVDGTNDGYSYPAPSEILRVTITPPSTQ